MASHKRKVLARKYGLTAQQASPQQAERDVNSLLAHLPQWTARLNQQLGTNIKPTDVLTFMIIETAGTFSPAIQHPAIKATGLSQLPPVSLNAVNKRFGTNYSVNQLKTMSVQQQLDGPIADYFTMSVERARRKGQNPTLDSAGELYLTVAAPAFLGSQNTNIAYRGSQADRNPAWDANRDGIITVGEIRNAAIKGSLTVLGKRQLSFLP
jgi:hypothetical protein